jgi:ParB family chromosome partitioning protein
MPKQRTGLGRGIDALIPDNLPMADDSYLDTSLPPTGIFEIPIGAVALNPQQPRAPLVEDDALLELAASIQEYGLLQPVLVTISGTDEDGTRYQLIAGERRLHAAQLAGLERVPAVIKEATPQLMLEMALVENLQRTDLNPLEEAQGYVMLIEEYGLTQEAVAQRVGRNRVTISNTIRLLQLPERVRGWLLTNPQTFSEGHARAVLQINGEDERIQAAQQIIAQEMSVRAAEELARRYNEASMLLTADRRGGKSRPQSYETKALEDEFTRAVQLKVRLQRTTRGKGSLTLYFSNEEQLQLLYQWLVANSPGGQQALPEPAYAIDAIDLNELASINGALGNGPTHGTNGHHDGHDGHDSAGPSGSGASFADTFDVAFDDE